MNDEKNSGKELNHQIWEAAGVVSVDNDAKGMNYGVNPKDSKKGGQIDLEVKEVLHNKGVMENLENNSDNNLSQKPIKF